MSRRPQKKSEGTRFRLAMTGWLFLGISFVLGLVAIRSQIALMFIIFGVMMGALHTSAFIAHKMILGLFVRREIPPRAWQNQAVHLGYYIRNLRKRVSCLAVNVDEISPEGIESVAGYCVHIPPKAAFRSGARFVATRRGRIDFQGVRLQTIFPFGLITTTRRISMPASLLVWPGRGKLTRQLLHRGAVETSSAAPSPATGGQDEFFGLREYRPDDNPRWIHWRRSATRSRLIVREMARPLPEELWVVLNTQCSDTSEAAAETLEKMLRFAATLIDYAFVRGYQVGMAISQPDRVEVYPPQAGRAHRGKLLDALAVAELNTATGMDKILDALHRRQLRHAQVIVVTEDVAKIAEAGLRRLKGCCRHLTALDRNTIPAVFQDAVSA